MRGNDSPKGRSRIRSLMTWNRQGQGAFGERTWKHPPERDSMLPRSRSGLRGHVSRITLAGLARRRNNDHARARDLGEVDQKLRSPARETRQSRAGSVVK